MRRYGCWAGNPDGTPEDITLCIVQVQERDPCGFDHQCFRKRGHGKDGLYCKQHARMIEQGHHLYCGKEQ